MRKFNKLYFSFIITSLLSVVGCVLGTAAWFMGMEEVSMGNTNGYTEASYFASGDGSEAKPFIITNKVHMYNLAWLQYLGQFNKIDEETGKVKQTYFRIGMEENNPITVDMTDMVLPPIGTKANPFLGNFDGNGSTLTNYIVSNKIDDNNITKKPLKVTNIDEVKIVGIFGVVGDIDSTYEGKYSSAVLNISDLYISKAEVKTYSSQSLIGIAAGYVNGTIDGVGVINSTVNVATSSSAYTALGKTINISDYTLIGYCEEAYTAKTVKATTSIGSQVGRQQKFVVEEEGDASGWGGSIDMKSMFTRLQNVNSAARTPTGNFLQTINKINDNGTITDEEINRASGYGSNNGGNAFTYKYYANDNAGSYYLGTGGQTNGNYFYYLYQETTTINNYNRTYVQGYKIQHNGNYLVINNGTTVGATTNANNATSFITTNNSLSFFYEHTLYYLNCTAFNAFTVSQTKTTSWSYDGTVRAYYLTAGNVRYYLQYESNAWKVIANNSFRILSGGNRLSINNNRAIANQTTDANASIWRISNTGANPNGSISIYTNSNVYYLRAGNGNLSVDTTAVNWVNNANKLYFVDNNNNRYIRYNRSWVSTTNAGNGSTLTFTAVNVTASNRTQVNTPYDTFTSSSRINSSYPTCFPLNAQNTSTFGVKEANTGYVISGGYSAPSGSGRGDIRVSRYANSNISQSYNADSKTLNNVFTINMAGNKTTIGTNHTFEKYDDAKSKMLNVLKGDDNVYGLHFMDASITTANKVTTPKAVINGNEYTNYEFPNDCIDFHLKEKGHINFFAGTYYNGNSSFFSLHKIERNASNGISAIKEIVQIYESNNPLDDYAFKYKDGSFSTGGTSIPTGYKTTPIFDTKVITNPGAALSTGSVYYFEIPCDAGEYALGSVSGRDGAYLMYLDISANAKEYARSEFFDSVKTTEGHINYPLGVAAVDRASAPVNPQDSVFVALNGSFSSTETISMTSTTNATLSSTMNASLVYKNDRITVKDSGNNVVQESPQAVINSETSRVVYVDVNTATRETVYFYAIKETVGTKTTYKYEAYKLQEDGSLENIYDTFTLYDWEGKPMSTSDSVLSAFGFKSLATINNTILSYSYEHAEVDGFTFEYKIKLSEIGPDGNDFFVSLLGYEIDANNSGGKTLTIQVSTKNNNLTFTYVGMSEA